MSWAALLDAHAFGDLQADLQGVPARAGIAYVHLMARLGRVGPVPFEDVVLAAVAGVGLKTWTNRIWPMIRHLFDVEDGYLCHPGIDGAHAVPAGPTARQASASHAARTRHERDRERRRQQLSLITGDAAQDAEPTAAHALRTAEAGSPHALRTAEEGSAHDQNPAISMRGAEIFRAESAAAHAPRSAEAPAAQARVALARTHTHTPLSSDSSLQSGESSGVGESGRGSGGGIAASAPQAAQRAETPAQLPAETPAHSPAQVRTFAAPRAPRPAAQAPTALAPIPADWQPSEQDQREARKRGYDPDEAAERFRDVYIASGRREANWSAKFRTFVRQGISGLTPQQSPQRGMMMPIAGGAAGSSAAIPAETAAKDRATAAWVAAAEAWLAGTPYAAGWARVRAVMQAEVGDVEYRAWLAPMALVGAAGDAVTIGLQTRFTRDQVQRRFGARLAALWRAENPAADRIDFVFQVLAEASPAASERARGPPDALAG
jgi:chromosomal replication initiator protein